MSITISDLLGAAGGGALGAALGALLVFSLMGAVLVSAALLTVATSSSTLAVGVALGPVLGPHVAFAGGVAAAAYAAHRGVHDSGRDIGLPLVVVSRPSVLAVGALFGMLGYLIAQAVAALPVGTTSRSVPVSLTDPLALSVVFTALIATALWGRVPNGGSNPRVPWLPWQHTLGFQATLGAASGCAAAGVFLAWPAESRSAATLLVFGLSSLSLIALVFGKPVPVTHHMTLPAALAAGLIARSTGAHVWVIVAAVAAGTAAALIAEGWGRLVLQRSRVHIDPPAFAIALTTSILAVLTLTIG